MHVDVNPMRNDLLETVRLSNQSLRIMTAMMTEAGLEPAPLLTQVGIAPPSLTNPQGEVTGTQELRFQQLFAAATAHIPGLWMRTGLRYRVMAYGPLGLAVLAAADVAEGLRVLGAFQALTFSLMHYRVEELDGEPVALIAEDAGAPEDLREFLQERALGSVTMFLNDMQQQHFPLERIETTLLRPPGWQGCDALLGAPVIFGAPLTRWVFAKEAGRLPLPMASPLLEETYRRLCSNLIDGAAARDEFITNIYQRMVRSGRGFPTAQDMAAQLSISERSLHRHLSMRKTSFGEILDNVRYQRAKELLTKSTLSIEQIGDMLGFAETASFSRAFKRWSGEPPRSYRQRFRTK